MLVDDKPVAAFYVDVNAAGESGQVGTTLGAAVESVGDAKAVGVGQYVWAVDADDNACIALVTERQGEWFQLHMDETTWTPLKKVAVVRSGEDRISLHGQDPDDVLRAFLRTPPKQD